jgi:hypothetical protein
MLKRTPGGNGSDNPMPRQSKKIKRANECKLSQKRQRWGSSGNAAMEILPYEGTRTSTLESPKIWYAT